MGGACFLPEALNLRRWFSVDYVFFVKKRMYEVNFCASLMLVF
jgi:hypothetical protein